MIDQLHLHVNEAYSSIAVVHASVTMGMGYPLKQEKEKKILMERIGKSDVKKMVNCLEVCGREHYQYVRFKLSVNKRDDPCASYLHLIHRK